jgi:predicted methyltransferase
VAELMTGRGYYAEILGRAVGPAGKVYAHNTPFVLDRFAEAPLSERLEAEDLANVVKHDAELEDLTLPEGQLDAVLIILFYHDTYWQEVDRAAMLRGVLAALRPGGVFGVIDHHAEVGSGDRDVKTLHRGDAEMIKAEILAAGFELEAESDLLRRPDDDRTVNVFDDAIRGKTDRFVFKFRKPD